MAGYGGMLLHAGPAAAKKIRHVTFITEYSF
jgi:hypothetical protein